MRAQAIPGTRLEEPSPTTRKVLVTGVGLLAIIALGTMAIRAAKEIRFTPARIDGPWQAVVTYDWGATHRENFLFHVDGDEVAGSASFLGTKRGVLGGRLGNDRISFDTKTRETLGDGEKETVHHYRGRIFGRPNPVQHADRGWFLGSPARRVHGQTLALARLWLGSRRRRGGRATARAGDLAPTTNMRVGAGSQVAAAVAAGSRLLRSTRRVVVRNPG